ncbi:2-keto-4-pentenoate hydratase/2-oxohepta-3-ene-1,7-dioic acid hydratase in catechol pathway [Orbus hercynius]|uniref:2-keto-4-pentenoate hydratase/2-oxohepta-3-ene-1,7-dioic acid hydratase in catechol pathway n=1 Tax=Orbus hercynius TaxID=593135 RepID=A0A495RK95_9GAMM|nr:fumarylacetoacetate hydrolase family protein [Orbus hercynius]RKS87720.1 2-keto-4-pentenoate hydratase/2-oxohepta-3-ene-1,7-dioic acid hydratase in catechol pathway [Orbus hercynius]
MKFISYLLANNPSYGILTTNGIIDLKSLMGDRYPDLKSLISCPAGLAHVKTLNQTPATVDPRYVTYLPVIPNPNKIICAGMNYADKRKEFDAQDQAVTLFVRFADTQVGHLSPVLKPSITEEFDYEGELAIIIGKPCFKVSKQEAPNYIAGYSCYMDGSVRDWQHTWFTAGKNWPKTGALGPCLTTQDEIDDFDALSIRTYLNKQMVQNDVLGNMVHKVEDIVSYISTFTQLSPGDVILTGSPGGVGKKRTPPLFMKPGDVIEVEIEKIGHLINTIVAE